MLKTKVSCWFCNKDSSVFILNKNSWTCTYCEQYNGFKKDGDYNKVIPEMEKESLNKKYCHSNGVNGAAGIKQQSNSILCDKCNQNQELKLNELKKFEANMDDKSEQEYQLYKIKLDQIYDLCRQCKNRVNAHLRQIDLQIGDNLLKHRYTNGNNLLQNGHDNAKPMPFKKPAPVSNNYKMQETAASKTNSRDLCENLTAKIKKAYTIAGTVPAYVFRASTSSSPSNRKYDKYEISPAKANGRQMDDSMNDSRVSSTSKSVKSTRHQSQSSISCNSLTIVLEDMFLYVLVLLVFASDLVNLLNDSGVLQISNNTSDDDWFKTLLQLYKQINLVLVLVIVLCLHLAYKRPKLSRFLIMLGFVFNFVLHFNLVFEFTNEEQFILESILSFFLLFYLSMARVYNLCQLVRYVGIM